MTEPTLQSSPKPRRDWLLCLGLIGAYLALRLPHLRDMPAFTDETTYARWAQLIVADPRHNLFVSMSDAKPPLHYWLLSLTRWLATDPILAGRLLSVIVGILIFPALFAFAGELARLGKNKQPQATLIATIAGVLLITSPLIAMQQRMIMAEALLLPQAIAAAWLSLRLARLMAVGAPSKRLLGHAIALGFLWASALLTKQVFSYFLWGFLPLAVLIRCGRSSWKQLAARLVMPATVMTVIGAACFVPAILSDSTQTLKSRLLYKPIFLPQADTNRFTLAWNHIVELFWPQADGRFTAWPHDPHAPLNNGILYLYLTPPILLLVIAAFVWMIRRRAWGLGIFLGGWTAVFLGSFLFGAGVIMSRYTALSAVPLLIAGAWLLADLAQSLRQKAGLIPAAALGTALTVAVLAWPASATTAVALNWQAPVYTSVDACQYVTEFGGGHVTEQTILWLAEQADDHPITVVTGSWVGTPNDAIWLYLSGNPNIQLYWDDYRKTMLHPVAPGTYLLGENRWADKANQRVPLDLSRPTFYIVPITHIRKTGGVQVFAQANYLPPHVIMQHFFNPTDRFDTVDYQELVIIKLEPGAKVASVNEDQP